MNLTNKQYDILKWIAQILLPALATLYAALAGIWGLPYGEPVVGTISAIDVFLGSLLQLSSVSYGGDGTLVVRTDDSGEAYKMVFSTELSELMDKDRVIFKVQKD